MKLINVLSLTLSLTPFAVSQSPYTASDLHSALVETATYLQSINTTLTTVPQSISSVKPPPKSNSSQLTPPNRSPTNSTAPNTTSNPPPKESATPTASNKTSQPRRSPSSQPTSSTSVSIPSPFKPTYKPSQITTGLANTASAITSGLLIVPESGGTQYADIFLAILSAIQVINKPSPYNLQM